MYITNSEGIEFHLFTEEFAGFPELLDFQKQIIDIICNQLLTLLFGVVSSQWQNVS